MFQVVLLSLMGSNNSAREIAGERPIYEKEKFGGLRPSAYLASKVAFLACLVIGAVAMDDLLRELLRQLSVGDFLQHACFLFLVNAAR
jgi:ABC transport system ATP-binding/permease protein